MTVGRFGVHVASAVALACSGVAANAELVVSDLVVELHADAQSRKDVEVWNDSEERSYVVVSPAEILNPGNPTEQRRQEPDPEKLGLLVSPNRMILEPGQRKLVRVARISPGLDQERIYRITVKPIVGDVTGEGSGLKVLVGYDVLVIVRPLNPVPRISGSRQGKTLIVRNDGNSSAELINGRQCDPSGRCVKLPGKRLYAGALWRQPLSSTDPVEYSVKQGSQLKTIRF
jgi:P pilus assembly chaperone PapD